MLLKINNYAKQIEKLIKIGYKRMKNCIDLDSM